MLVIIEHSGTNASNKIVKQIEDFIESEFGFTCQDVIGLENSPITLYNDQLEKIVDFYSTPDESTLSYYLTNFYEEE